MSQPTLDGMPEPLYSATPARLSAYLDCPRRYRLSYLDRPSPSRGPARATATVGAAVHLALARWWGLAPSRRTPDAGGTLLVEAWRSDGFRDDAQSAAALARSRAQVVGYLGTLDPGRQPLAVERTVSVRTPHAVLWGRVDRLDGSRRPSASPARAGSGAVVVDYKTGRRTPTPQDARDSLALAVYAAGASAATHHPCRRVELHHLPSREVAAWEHTDASLGDHLDRADAVAVELTGLDAVGRAPSLGTEVADESFPARVGPRCGWCDVRSSCAPGRAVPARPAWDGVRD